MQFAVINNLKVKPIKGQIGFCPMCGAEMIARCGEIKIHHWAHKGKLHCDKWWESETQWHRNWKNYFPVEWQEIIHKDSNDEKHIADIKTPHGLVVEFQHSYISKEERDSRESFYKHMIWIVDGTRRKSDLNRYKAGARYFNRSKMPNVVYVPYPEEVMPKEWSESKEIVIIDFNGESQNLQQKLVMFWRPKGKPLMQCMILLKSELVSWIKNGELVALLKEF